MDDVRRELRILRIAVTALAAMFAMLLFAAFSGSAQKQHFGEIDVERLNLVEKDGSLRMVLSNKARFPGAIMNHKEYTHPRGVAGMLFYNDEGDEDGGLTFMGKKDGSGHSADAGIMFDQYHQDQVVGMQYTDENGSRTSGFSVWDRPDASLGDLLEKREVILHMPAGSARDSAMTRLFASVPHSATRGFFGRARDKSSVVQLADASGRVRLRIAVDSAGSARIEFLDAGGKITRVISEASAP